MDETPGPQPTHHAAALAAASTAHFLSSHFASVDTISRSNSPGPPYTSKPDEDDKKRYRPRTFSYFNHLPFPVEEESRRDAALAGILKQLYIAVKAEDFSPGALHWTRELQGWLNLKFEMTRELRATLAKLYYHLCLAPGLDSSTADRFLRMVVVLTRKYHYLKPVDDLLLDWRPLWREIKTLVLPSEVASNQTHRRRSQKQLWKLCLHAQTYFDPKDRKEMLEELLPYFSTSDVSNAYIVVGAINALLPTDAAPENVPCSQPQELMPTLFHLWSLIARSKSFDVFFVDLYSRMARDFLQSPNTPFDAHGIFTQEQSDWIFTAVLRLTEIPVGQSNSPYSTLDYSSGLGLYLEKDKKKYPTAYMIARWIVYSLSSKCLDQENSILASLEGLLEAIDTFYHPSNVGSWTTFLGQFTVYLTDIFVSRWNREQSGELDTPEDRRITPALKLRFVAALKEVTYMGLFSKSNRVAHYYYASLQGLAYLEPNLILPGALQRFYPSLQGLVEVHRTTSSLNGLQMIANVMSKTKGFRCHITALLALALPGIDANDLGKTQYTLNFIQSVAYSIPMVPLVKDSDSVHDTTLAMNWVSGQMERMEQEGQDIKIDYATELDDETEANILRSSTAGLGEFVIALLGKVFTLLENLPDASHIRGGTPEDNVINALPAALSPLFASLSPELFDTALEKLSSFVSSHVVHQARDAMAWILNALCKVNPEKTLKVFIPMLIVNIRNEIDFNQAASDRSSGTEYLPRDRALVWHISMLGMAVVHVGNEVLKYQTELHEIAKYMQKKCRGLSTIHISNYIHHLLLNLTHTYPIDSALYEPDVIARGLDVQDWGKTTSPADLTIKWHRPSAGEVQFAVELFDSQTKAAAEKLDSLMSENPPVSRKGKNKEWSDEVSRHLQQIRLLTSGVATLFDPHRASGESPTNEVPGVDVDGDIEMDDDDPLAEAGEDEETRPQYRYDAGYLLTTEDPAYHKLHELREDIGRLLCRTHEFLNGNQEDDVACFTALYAAYRTWITDVGIERSAHPLERHLRLYKSDISAFKISGLRKVYPRPLLIKRADAYQLLRVKHNASARQKSELDKQLLLNLAQSSVSSYADVRRVAQSALDSSLKALIGGRPLVIPILIERLRVALKEIDHDRIKGAMYTLFFTTLLKTLMKDWRFAPEAMRLYLKAGTIDKPSIQQLSATALFPLLDFGKPFERMIIVDQKLVDQIRPDDDCARAIDTRHNFIVQRRQRVEKKKAALGLELVEAAKEAHWKIASRCVIFATNLCLRFDTLAPPEFITLVTTGTNDSHPGLRTSYMAAFTAVFETVEMRAAYDHEYRNYLLEKEKDKNKLTIEVARGDAAFTQKYLGSFATPENAEYMVDADHPGWLVWGKKFLASRAKPMAFTDYDERETAVRQQIGKMITRDWLQTCFNYLKQEPRDANADRFRMGNVYMLMHVFDLMHYGGTDITLDDVKELTTDVFSDGSDKHQHRATAEILAALLAGSSDDPPEFRNKVWEFAATLMLKILNEHLTPENLQYWVSCLHLTVDPKDPRRSHELVETLSSFRLDMSSNAAFKESSKVQVLEFIITDAGWHFRHEKPILEDFLAHIDHPYKTVREAMGRVIATIYRTRYHESFENVDALLVANKAASSLGIRPYQPTEEFSTMMLEIFERLEKWRHERAPGQQTPSSYTSGSKTVLTWLDNTLSSQECTQLMPFFPEPYMEQLLHMMDVKEDPELMRLAYHVYRHLPNIPFRVGEDSPFIDALVRIGKSASSWHQRLRSMVNMQVIYFRRLFLIKKKQREILFNAVSDMLADPQLEVRSCASATLAGMIRCSPKRIRDPTIQLLKKRYENELRLNPMPKRKLPGTETPVDTTKQIVRRHAAVLGLGALIEAFPYATPPPLWMPEVLQTLATRAASDPGIVGKATKSILSDFKKTRQDSWTVDQKYFSPEQLEDLEGVLWKSYFA
ncbi:Proteasome activator complex subunit 4 [Colletotrichum orbiculare MAFF 240422]|uniref:Proteasome activator complex subunit 4 n=1 Tax=Colletotrichum orbiculare (strain 104-T / ATCC 96160 / CBS 514.97 / LARS 414 / MAFF 240422) TaxID=1213857 RepID=N4W3L8_COLOR|nr:Proteasome activator complex subunit 4 [Colletotrichum orbiculare MAFF 240422]